MGDNGPVILRHIFTPPNNTRLANLAGPMDEHLRTIESGLQVAIAHRHGQFKVDGPKKQAEREKFVKVLPTEYKRALGEIHAKKMAAAQAAPAQGASKNVAVAAK